MKQSDCLAYRILKAKYFPRTNMLQAGLGHSPSYLWRSILAAKGVVEEGIRWRVGNDKLVNILTDRWVGIEDVQIPNMIVIEKVEILIDEDNKSWKCDLIQMNFTRETTNNIHDMPLSFCRSTDQMIWRYTPHIFFTVKSIYQVTISKYSHLHNKRP